jgi:hypothetical protein
MIAGPAENRNRHRFSVECLPHCGARSASPQQQAWTLSSIDGSAFFSYLLCETGPPPTFRSASPSSEAEAHPNRGINIAMLEETEAQSAMHLVEHHAKIEIPFWRKSPIRCGRNRIIRPGALRVRAGGAEGGTSRGGAEPLPDWPAGALSLHQCRAYPAWVVCANNLRQ